VIAALVAPALPAVAAAHSSGGQPAPSAPPPRPALPARPSHPLTASQSRQIAADRVAQATAIRQHTTVAVPSQTTETSITLARPDGSMESVINVMPVRVKIGGTWRPLDPTLVRLRSGLLAPRATPSGLTLSAGGTGPMATFTSPAGGTMALTFPARLPVPSVSGATATYHNVLPGVDLALTATQYGGLTELLIIRSAQAAASPQLRGLRLGLASRGLTPATVRGGSLTATGPEGFTEFTSSPPAIWDSRTSPGSSSGRNSFGPAVSSAAGPGRSARMAAVTTAVSGGALTLRPPASMLSPVATYPSFLAASVSPAFSATGFSYTSGRNGEGYAMARDDCVNTPDWNNPNPGVGWQDYSGDCGGGSSLYRTFWQIDTGENLNSAMQVQKATMTVTENYGADWTCSDRWTLTLKLTKGINSGTDWSNQPAVDASNQTRTYSAGPANNPNHPGCPKTVAADFDVMYAVNKALSSNWSNLTFGLYGDESKVSTNYGFMRFATNPTIVTTFDLYPPTPATSTFKENPPPRDTPGGADDYGCGSTIGWINQKTMSLSATVSSNITNEQVRGEFQTWDYIYGGGSQVNSSYVKSGDNVSVNWPASNDPLLDGHQYWWYPGANVDGSTPGTKGGTDGNNTTGYTSWSNATCYFNVDLSTPNDVAVTSTDYPASGTGTTSKLPGQSGAFTLSANDPIPSNAGCSGSCVASGIYRIYYSLNSPVPTGGGGTYVTAPANYGNQLIQVSTPQITVGNWGTNILYVMAQDTAGNWSTQVAYTFYVPWNSSQVVHPGDVNGDNIPDLLGTSSTNLVMFPGNADPSATPVVAGPQAASPASDGSAWNSFQITHRGSFSQGAVDDLFAHKGASMYVYLNNLTSPGATPQFGTTSDVTTIPADPTCATTFADNTTRSGNCANYPTTNNWSLVTQILAPGDAFAGSSLDNGEPSLLTVENNELWLYQGLFGGQVGNPVLLGSSGGTTNWSQMTLIAPGVVNGQLTLWARDNSTGTIYSYPLIVGSDDLPTLNPSSPATPVTATSGTAITGVSIPVGTYPAAGSAGPLDGTAYPGLYVEKTSGGPADVNCANGCLYYYPGQATTGSNPLNPNPVFVGVLHTPVTQLS
jgi:hypothetical protein